MAVSFSACPMNYGGVCKAASVMAGCIAVFRLLFVEFL